MNLKRATSKHTELLWRALAWAAHMPGEGSAKDVRVARQTPALAVYVDEFGRVGDEGFVAFDDAGAFLGAGWWRFMRGYGFVDEETPELCIGVAPDARGRGVGGAILEALLARHHRVCLSVREDNPAVRLYERLGFAKVPDSEVVNRVGGVSFIMVREITPG